ncbi:uncharacterized protein [Primulina huaijiensis]|uniref:uncharacterized protein isoform X2 n=1 Tax=Primulina huaijiensis TaxID=1492673 RepID=UPI003CC6FF1A
MFIEEPIENCMLYSLGEGRSWDQAVVASAIWLHDGLTRYRDLEERRADMVDPQPSQNLAEEVLKILAEGDDPEVGTKLLVHLQFDKFSLIKCLLRSRLKVVWCTCLAKAEVGNAVGASAIWPHDALARDRDLEERRAYLGLVESLASASEYELLIQPDQEELIRKLINHQRFSVETPKFTNTHVEGKFYFQ